MTLNRKGGDEIAQTIRLRTQEKHFLAFSWTVPVPFLNSGVVFKDTTSRTGPIFPFRSAGGNSEPGLWQRRVRNGTSWHAVSPASRHWLLTRCSFFISFSFLYMDHSVSFFVSLKILSRHKEILFLNALRLQLQAYLALLHFTEIVDFTNWRLAATWRCQMMVSFLSNKVFFLLKYVHFLRHNAIAHFIDCNSVNIAFIGTGKQKILWFTLLW